MKANLIFQDYLEINGFFIYLFLVSDLYFLFIVYQVLTAKEEAKGKPRIVENDRVSKTWIPVNRFQIYDCFSAFIYLIL